MKELVRLLVFLLFVPAAAALAQNSDTSEAPVAYNTGDVKWVDAPPLPKGAKMAVLAGNPGESGPFTRA